MASVGAFKAENTFAERRARSDNIYVENPDLVGIVLERAYSALDVGYLPRSQYVANKDKTVRQFLDLIRSSLRLDPKQTIFFFVGNGILAKTGDTMGILHMKYKDQDGFLYMEYNTGNAFS